MASVSPSASPTWSSPLASPHSRTGSAPRWTPVRNFRSRRRIPEVSISRLRPQIATSSSARSARPLARAPAAYTLPSVTPPQDLIGASPRRKEDHRLLTRTGRYADDLMPPGMLHMAVVRSRHAHARTIKIGVEAARALPGVAADFTAADLPEINRSLP